MMDYNPHLPQILVVPSRKTGPALTEASVIVYGISTVIPAELIHSPGTLTEMYQYAGDYIT